MECAILRVGIYQAITQVALLVVASTTCSEVPQEEAAAGREMAPSWARETEPRCPLYHKAPDPSTSNRKISQQ